MKNERADDTDPESDNQHSLALAALVLRLGGEVTIPHDELPHGVFTIACRWSDADDLDIRVWMGESLETPKRKRGGKR